jgi:hypothetical protein
VRSCRQQPREYPFAYTIPNANQLVPNTGQALDQDAAFLLSEIVPLNAAAGEYRIQVFDPALMPLHDSPIDPFYQVFDPPVYYPPGGKILMTVEDISGHASTVVNVLFRGINEFTIVKTADPEGPVLEVPKSYYLQVAGVENFLLQDQLVDLDIDAEFELRQVLVNAAGESLYQFFDRDHSLIQYNGLNNLPGQGIYQPGIRYPKGGQILVNLGSGAALVSSMLFTGVNRYRVQ